MSESPVPASARTRPGAGQVIGELLLTAGAILLLFVIYEAFWTNIVSGRLQAQVDTQLEETWSADPGTAGLEPVVPVVGEGFARVHLPSLGIAYAIVEGTGNDDLKAGPGHYPYSQLPGEAGNFALAGHRNGSGAVFEHLDRLGACDAVVIETQTEWLTYRLLPLDADTAGRRAEASACLTPVQVDRFADGDYAHVQGRYITTPGDVDVVNPLPRAEWVPPEPELESTLTLTTCHPLFSNTERMIVHAVLVDTVPKSSGGKPAALQER